MHSNNPQKFHGAVNAIAVSKNVTFGGGGVSAWELDELDMPLTPQGSFVIVGTTGSGKTTVFKAIIDLEMTSVPTAPPYEDIQDNDLLIRPEGELGLEGYVAIDIKSSEGGYFTTEPAALGRSHFYRTEEENNPLHSRYVSELGSVTRVAKLCSVDADLGKSENGRNENNYHVHIDDYAMSRKRNYQSWASHVSGVNNGKNDKLHIVIKQIAKNVLNHLHVTAFADNYRPNICLTAPKPRTALKAPIGKLSLPSPADLETDRTVTVGTHEGLTTHFPLFSSRLKETLSGSCALHRSITAQRAILKAMTAAEKRDGNVLFFDSVFHDCEQEHSSYIVPALNDKEELLASITDEDVPHENDLVHHVGLLADAIKAAADQLDQEDVEAFSLAN